MMDFARHLGETASLLMLMTIVTLIYVFSIVSLIKEHRKQMIRITKEDEAR